MAGLSVLLESHHQKTFQKCPQIISKTTHGLLLSSNNRKNKILSATPPSPPPLPLQRSPSFLERCYLCHDRLLEGKDIYMYRGDRAFCSEECRCRQICMDEEAAAAAASSAAGRRRCGKSRAGGFGY